MTKFEECARAIASEMGGNCTRHGVPNMCAHNGSINCPCRRSARAVLQAMREPGARIVQDCAIASAIASGCGCEYRGARVLCNSEHLPADLRSKECSCYAGAAAAIANLVDAILAEDAA